MTTPVDFWLKHHDLKDPLIVTPRDARKEIVVFPFGVTVTFSLRNRSTSVLAIAEAPASLIDAIDPVTQVAYQKLEYDWTPTDRDTLVPGTYIGEFTVLYPDPAGSEQTYPNPDPLIVQVIASVRSG